MATTKNIGQILIDKAKELDPTYKPDGFNDMGEATKIILNNMGVGSGGSGGGGSDDDTLVLNEWDSMHFLLACVSFMESEESEENEKSKKNRVEFALEGEYDFTRTYKYLALSGEEMEGAIFTFTDSMSYCSFGIAVLYHLVIAFTVEQDPNGNRAVFYKIPVAENDTLELDQTDSESFYEACETILKGGSNKIELILRGDYRFTENYKYLALTGSKENVFNLTTITSPESSDDYFGGIFMGDNGVVAFKFKNSMTTSKRILFYKVGSEDDTLWLSEEDAEQLKTCLNAVLAEGEEEAVMKCKTQYEWNEDYQYLGARGEGIEEATIRFFTNKKNEGPIITHYGLYVHRSNAICPIELCMESRDSNRSFSIKVVKPIG